MEVVVVVVVMVVEAVRLTAKARNALTAMDMDTGHATALKRKMKASVTIAASTGTRLAIAPTKSDLEVAAAVVLDHEVETGDDHDRAVETVRIVIESVTDRGLQIKSEAVIAIAIATDHEALLIIGTDRQAKTNRSERARVLVAMMRSEAEVAALESDPAAQAKTNPMATQKVVEM